MSKYVRTIYLYVVSFITLCMVVIGLINTVNSIASYYYPSVYYYTSYGYENDNYENNRYNEEILNKKRSSLKEMIAYMTVTVVGLPLFMYHWKLALKEEKSEV